MAGPGYVGALRGSLSVDSDGGASYAVPLDVPPGTSNMVPKLSVVYNSGAGVDLLGVGWSLRGLSSITRAPQTPAQDGAWVAVSYGPGDRFALDGQRLVPVSGSYGDSDAIYHTEVESWARVVPVYYGQNGNSQTPVPGRQGPDAFMVTTKDGKVHEYGTTPDSQVVASQTNPSIRVWAVSRVTDRFGNTVSFSYTPDDTNNTYYPAAISYTANEAAGLVAQRTVVFAHEPRPAPDAVTRYQGGYPVTNVQRLHSIETQLDGAAVLTYTFGYETGGATGRSRLISITKADGAGTALPPTTFEWQDAAAGLLASSSDLPADTGLAGTFLSMDVNGDGRVDLVRSYELAGALAVDLLLSDGAGFAPAVTVTTGIEYGSVRQVLPMDTDGNGRCDLVVSTVKAVNGVDNLALAVLTASESDNGWSFTLTSTDAGPAGLLPPQQLAALDVDGDGLVDLVYTAQEGTHLKLLALFSTGSGFIVSPTDQTAVTALFFAEAQYLPLDVDGNGMADLLYATPVGTNYGFTLFRSHGRRGFTQESWGPPAPLEFGRAMFGLDVNGDGIDDVVHVEVTGQGIAVRTVLNTGAAPAGGGVQVFTLPFVEAAGAVVVPTDVNGDGLPDLAVVTAGEPVGPQLALTVLVGTGSGFTQVVGVTQPSATAGRGTLLPVDYPGDGRPALLCTVNVEGALSLWAMPPAGDYPDLMTTITNGLGGQVVVQYAPLTDPGTYTSAPPAPGQVDGAMLLGARNSGVTAQISPQNAVLATAAAVPATRAADFPKYVVSGYTRSDGRGNRYGYQQHYLGALLDLTGRGWLGFQSVVASDLSQGTTCTTTYNQLFPWSHTPASTVQARASDQATMSTQAWTYDPPPPTVPASPVAVLPGTRTTGLYTFGTLDLTQQAVFAYDDYGNVKLTAETSSDPNSPPLWTAKTFQNDPLLWRLGFCLTTVVTADAAGKEVLSSSSTTYDPETWAVGTESAWDDQAQIWRTTIHNYDPFGNETSVTDPSGATTTTTYDAMYQTFPQTIASPARNVGGSLSSSFTYYPAFGVKHTSTDPNNILISQDIDGLGRMTARMGPGLTGAPVTLSTHAWVTDESGTYDEVQVLREWSGEVWSWSRRYLDGMGRVYRMAGLGPDGATPVYVDRTFDNRNQVLTQSLPYYDGQPPATRVFTYDCYGRTTSVTEPPASATTPPVTTTFSYPTSTTTVQVEGAGTAAPRTTTITYGWAGHLRRAVLVVDNSGSSASFGYDAIGRLVSATSPVAQHSFGYDTLGRRISTGVTPPATGTPVWFAGSAAFDDTARTVTETDSAGNTVVSQYDALRRLLTKTVNGGPPTTFAYDDPSHANAQGRCSEVVMPDGTTYSYVYDPYGRQAAITLILAGTAYNVGRTTKPTGAIDELTFPDGTTLTKAYNPAGSVLTIVETAAGQSLTGVTYRDYDAYGQAHTALLGNGAVEAHAFDALGRPTGVTLSGSGGQGLVDQAYTWDALNLLTGITDNLGAANSQSFLFDPVGRLKTATGPYGAEGYNYDGAGNLTEKAGVTYNIEGYRVTSGSAGGEEVVQVGYDGAGSMTSVTRSGVSTAYQYDGERRLVSAGASAFSYDHSGRRLMKTSPDGTVTYYVAPYYEVVALPGGGVQHTRYAPGNRGVAMAVTVTDAPGGAPPPGVPVPGRVYLHGNHLRSTTAVTGATGALVTSLVYQPFGQVSAVDGPDEVRQKFTGKELDAETSLYYFHARYYDPSLGRFLTVDDRVSVTGPRLDGLNLYAYGLNDPTGRTDPTGHFSFSSLFRDIGEGFSDLGHDLDVAAHATVNFFSHDVGTFFAKNWAVVVSMLADYEMTVAGIAVLALTPIDGGAGDLLGESLLGAGTSGFAYDISALAEHQKFSWRDWGINVGTGILSGALAVGASEVGDIAVDVAANRVSFFASGLGKGLLMTAKWGAENAVSGLGGQFAQNLLTEAVDRRFTWKGTVNGLGWNTLMGFATGAAGGAGSAILGKIATGEVSALNWAETAESTRLSKDYSEIVETTHAMGLEADPSLEPKKTFTFEEVDMQPHEELLVNVLPDFLITWVANDAYTYGNGWPQW